MSVGYYSVGDTAAVGAIKAADSGASATVVLYYGSEDYVSLPTDAAPNQFYRGVMAGLTLQRSAIGGRQVGGPAATTRGRLELVNPDGALDLAFAYGAVDGRRIVVKALPRNDPPGGESLDDAFTLFDGIMAVPQLDLTRVRVPLACRGLLLQQPIQSQNFGGTGGADGNDDLKGKPFPVALGRRRGVVPVYLGIIGGKHTYMVSGGDALPISDVPAFYDRGVALTQVGGAPGSGEYMVDSATGLVTIGGTVPEGPTCEVDGYAPGGSFKQTTADIWQAVLLDFAGEANARIDSSSVNEMNADQPATVGLWIGPQERTVAAVLDELLAGATALAGCDRRGVHRIRQLKEPGGVVRAVYDDATLLDMERIEGPEIVNPTAWKILVNWRRNDEATTNVAAAASEAQRAFMAEPVRQAAASSSTIQTRHRSSKPFEVPGVFDLETDAEAEAARLVSLLQGKSLWRMRARNIAPELDIGHTVEVTKARFGMAQRLGVIVDWSLDLKAGRFDPVVLL